MNSDMWSALGDVDRSLTTGTREGREVRVLVVEKTYDAPPPEVWDAVTTRERIARWLGPVTGDLEPGGRFQVEGNAGGSVLRCEEPRLLEVTWEFGEGVSWVVVTLAAEGDGTRLRLEHAADLAVVPPGDFGPGAVGIGWEMALGGLRLHLADPGFAPGDAPFADPGYPAFVRRAASGWAEADAAAGTDPTEARAAADRCVAAYTEGSGHQ